jgi:phosphatidylserine/phosphatidylglycerophosphate/cardiolipin synthase-like enzyme
VSVLVNATAPRLAASREPIRAGGSVWAMSALDLDALLTAGARVFAFQIGPARPWEFLHRKLAVLDDAVIVGSHNYNVPSSAFFDEASLEVEDPALAAELARIYDADLATNGQAVDAAAAREEAGRPTNKLLRWLSLPYLGYM